MSRPLIRFLVALSALLLATAAGAQTTVIINPGGGGTPINPKPILIISQSATSLDSIADQNGDGLRDLIAGDSDNDVVRLLSGRNGALLNTITSVATTRFGHDVANFQDLDGDGLEDLLVTAPDFGGVGRAYIFSSATGALLRGWGATTAGTSTIYGTTISRAGDLNGDGIEEVLVGDPLFVPAAGGFISHVGLVEVVDVSGAPTVIGALTGTIDYEQMGDSVANLGDVDGDFVDDFAVGATRFFAPGGVVCQPFNLPGIVRVYSGSTLALISSTVGTGPGDTFGISVDRGNFDLDAATEWVAGAPDLCQATTPYTLAETGVTALSPADPSLHFGWAVSGIGNAVGANYDEYVVGAPSVFGGIGLSGRAMLINGRNGNVINTFSPAGAGLRYGLDVTELYVAGGFNYFAVADPDSNRIYVYGW